MTEEITQVIAKFNNFNLLPQIGKLANLNLTHVCPTSPC